MDFIAIIDLIVFAIIVPATIIIGISIDEKRFKKELKEEYDELYTRLDEI